jgi:hypothetical protein
MDNIFNNTFNYKVIYVFKIYDEAHKGILKVGESTLRTNAFMNELKDNCDLLNKSANDRIRNYTNTIGVQVELLYTTLAINHDNKVFKDKDVHKVLKNSGIKKHDFHNDRNPEEWFETNLETVINAINATKEGRKALSQSEVDDEFEDIEFRPEQIEAIEKTLKRFETTDRMLWNAKMRFGKTLSTLEVIKRMSKSDNFKLKRAIILTHRPVVDEGWFEDYTKIFHNDEKFLYGSKRRLSIQELQQSNKNFIYFASMQDLRESNRIGGIYLKNDDVFDIDWDLIVIDEAHEGTQTELGKKVLEELLKSDTDHNVKQLHLSGTPFNLLSEFENKDIYTWDYIMEQKAKSDWEVNHPFEPNPYDDLPKLNILTYNLEEFLPNYVEVADKAFNFREFFRVWTGETEKDGKEIPSENLIGKFIHEDDVKKFLQLISHESDNNNYPFSKKKYRENFRHSFWILPGVKEAKALKELMLQDEAFSMFDIVNVAGSGDNSGNEALDDVHNAIGKNPEETYTITLSCGKLTTGVTVKEWSAVLYLSGSYSTSASSYLQTIFRVQSPANFGGKQKTECYVFDFAPDRTLKMVAQAGDLSIRAGSTGSKETMKQFLNYCPVIAVEGSEMKPYNVNSMLQQLKQAYVERVVDNGFDDVKIYNDNLYKLDEDALKKFENLKGIIGATKQKGKINDIDVNNQGFNEEEWTEIEKAKKKPKAELTEEQKRLLEEQREKNKQKNDAISILRGISIRIPLLIYGANISDEDDITIDNFTDIVDDVSWDEFMPKGVTKEMFKEFSQYYDNDIFIGAGRRIRNIAKHADTLNPIERAITISEIFSTFRNPDKETVLTPWRTVNMHMGDTIGGYNFYDEKYLVTIEEPRLINNGDVTYDVLFNQDAKILELNSKTGLYPLYVTISLFKQRCLNTDSKKLTEEIEKALWDKTLEENVFVICKTQMAKTITKRTLVGYRNVKTNIINIENIVDVIDNDFDNFKKYITNQKTWKMNGDENMKFDAIIGNPPYQENVGNENTNRSLAKQLYPSFIICAIKLKPKYITFITPSRWFTGEGQDHSFPTLRKFVKENNHFVNIINYGENEALFKNVSIGSVNYFLWDNSYEGDVNFVEVVGEKRNSIIRPLFEKNMDEILPLNIMVSFVNKIYKRTDFISLKDFATGRNPFKVPDVESDLEKLLSQKKDNEHQIKIQCANERIMYISKNQIKKNENLIYKYKVFSSKMNGAAGTLMDDGKVSIIGKSFVGERESVCSGALITFGNFDTLEEAKNLQKYMSTKFLRFMVGIMKSSRAIYQNVYQFVPMQDFSNKSDINWNCSIIEIDMQLFKKYNLSDDEINFINNKIKDMN